MATSPNAQIVDEFENSFQACLAALTNPDYFNIRDSEEVKTGVEQTIQRFLDLARQMECFFLQKRLILSAQKPEQIVMEDNTELKNELSRKEQLLQKYHEKIQYWQSLLTENSNAPGPLPSQTAQQQSQQPQPPQPQQQSNMPPNQPNMAPVMPQQGVPPPSMQPQQTPPQHIASPTQPMPGPLHYLERTTSNIGMPEVRR